LLAILKAGGAYVPLDASYPEQRLAFMLEDSRPRVLLTTRALAPRLSAASHLPRVFVEEVDLDGLPAAPPDSGVCARNLAYVVFTSGSTGRPKGVAVEHRSLMRLLHAPRYAHLGPEETFLLIAPISFDASVLEVWGALAWGARLVVFPPESPGDLELLSRVVTGSGVTTLHLTAGLFSRVVDWKLESLRGLRQLLTGGDVVSAPHVRKALEELRIPVTACYGPTEATLFTSCFRMTEPHQPGTVVPIGRPLANTEVYVLDARGQPVPVGVPGELFVGGPGLARGYLGQPELTAERFVPHPFSPTPGERLYRTGDLARWREDGVLEFLGRADTQVKVRGFRIELAEVEAALLAHPTVREAVAVVREDVPGDKRLVAYVVPRAEPPVDTVELRGFLQQRLPEYMRPSALVALPALPLTANAKVDRKALPPPPLSRPALATAYVPPSGPHQELLARLWSQVLGIEGPGAADDFFALGGSSLAAIQLLAHVRQTFGVEVPLRRFFEAPTLAGQAACLAQLLAGGHTALPPVEPTARTAPIPLSFSQERVWFIRQLSPENSAYNTSFHVRFEGPLDAAVLERAFTEIVRRHESLRSTFEAREDGPAQVVHPPYAVHLPLVPLEHLTAGEREQEIARRRSALMHHVFDFSQLPLFRYELLRLAPDDHLLLGVEQHLIHDGRSLAVLMHELKALYAAFAEGHPSPLPEPTLQLADLTSWQRRTLKGERLESLTRYWKQALADAPMALELPLDRPRPAFHRFQGRELRLRIPESLWRRLRAFSREEGSTLYMTMLSAFYALLHRYSGAEDVVVGSAFACRERPEMEGLIGMLVNSAALRANLSGQPTFRELLRRVRDVALGAYEHQGLPFDRVVEAVNPKRVPGLHPLFQVDFSFHDSPMPVFELPGGVRGRLGYSQFESAKFDLTLTVIPLQEGAEPAYDSAIESGFMNWEFNTDIFDAATIERLSRHYFTLLESALAHPERRLRELSLLSEPERQQLLREGNDTARPLPEATVVELFEAQVDRAPDALALTSEAGSLSYRELDARANRLAHRLRSLGVGPESRVALCLERSVDLVVGLLGILKSGAACVPMDPLWPTERLRLLLEDSGARLAVARPALMERLGQDGLKVLEPDAPGEPAHAPERRLHAGSLACVLYTSGSTGRPKGVMLTHGSLTHHHLWHARYCGLHAGDRVLQFHSISFDAALEELFPTWLSGATVVLRPAELFASAAELFSWAARERLTVLDFPTAYWHQLVQEMEGSGARPPDSVRLLLVAGERALPEALAAWRRLGGEASRWANLYGPTETTLISTAYELPAHAALPEGRAELPIGSPIDNTQAYVLDARLEPVPPGAPGELYIGGLGVARGYLGRPELTAERFIPDAFSAVPGARLYRTGDKVRRRADGALEFLGRLDRQLKLRGFRIELGEVEAALGRHPEVREALAVARPGRSGEQELVGYVVAAGRVPTVAELRRHLQGSLPGYMVPARLVVVEAFPLTPNGKVDVAALPVPEEGEEGREQSGPPPSTPTEEAVAAIWREVLGLGSVGRHDNFFDLGGHSLLALRVVSRIRKALGAEVPLAQVFEKPTLAELALGVEQGQKQQQPARPALVPRARRARGAGSDSP
ncbi:amino acid adenylation domain-containing protein, partial [Archangium sp.]|uniref:amino acid adenylation domain-containing protein n=1 Tax=Archangium sp. TaxID=1872627 RepID=UPI00389B29B2